MAVHYHTKGFFLKEINRGESDKLFVVYTKDFGKIKILGRAIRKIKSKLRGGAGLFYLSEIEFIQGKTHKTLTDTILIDSFQETRKNLEKLKVGFQINEVLDKLVDEEKDEKVWSLLNETFNKLNNCSLFIVHCSLLYYYFFWNLLSILGYQPELYKCAFCEKELKPNRLFFSVEHGGAVCENCAGKKLIEITPEVIKILRIILKKDWFVLSRLKIKQDHRELLANLSENYLSSFLENS